MTTQELLIAGGATVISLLLAGNIYFVKRLIDKIDATSEKASEAIRGVKDQGKMLSEIKSELKDLRRLEIDVAVVKSALGVKIGRLEGASRDFSSAS